jgi:hypothetical protein
MLRGLKADAQACQNCFSASWFRGFLGKFVLSTSASTGSAAADSVADPIRPCITDYRFQNTKQKHSSTRPQKRFSFWRLDTVFCFRKEKNGVASVLPHAGA